MKPSDYSDDDVRCAINSIKYGHDPEAAHNLIEYFHACLDRHLPFNDRLLKEYIRHTLGLIVEGKTPDVALGLKTGRGCPSGVVTYGEGKESRESRDMKIAAFVFKKIREINAERGSGKNWEVAIGEAANKFFKGRKTIEDIYGKYHRIFEEIPDGELDVILSALLEE